MIVTDKNILSIPCSPVLTRDEGLAICDRLRQEVNNHPDAIGLAANQIGINKRCFIYLSKSHVDGSPMWLNAINPEVTDRQNSIIVKTEGCLSFPGEQVMTRRFRDIWMTSWTYYGTVHYDGIEAICIQHELDHLDGITMHEREWKSK